MRSLLCLSMCLAVTVTAAAAGPNAGESVPTLQATKIQNNQSTEADFAKQRADKPTVYIFIREKQRSDLGFVGIFKAIDAGTKQAQAGMVLIFLSNTPRAATDYLEARKSIFNLPNTEFGVHDSRRGPEKWQLDPNAAITAVMANDGHVVNAFNYDKASDADAAAVLRALSQ